MGSKIKGGGRAIMSADTQEAIIDLLISVEREDRGEPCHLSDLSLHDKKLMRKTFVKKLVRRHEWMQLQQKYSTRGPKKENCDGASMHQLIPSSDITNPNVRIELAEAIFAKPKEEKKKKTKDEKGKSNKKKSRDEFKMGSKRVIVMPRTTSISELLKLSQSKLKLKKKPVCAFLQTYESSSMIFELNDNLETIADGMVVYVSVSPPPTDNHPSDEEAEDMNEDENATDPLELVKQAYKQQDLQRQQKQCQRMDEIINESQRNKHAETRAKLPVASQKQFILETISNNNVVILSGNTGSGKSTQVPQFLMECQEQDTKRPYTVVTQPRKVAAVSLAYRVASERGCPPPGTKGSSVGYIVRLDRQVDLRSCRVIYMTIGILLRMLVQHDAQREPDNVDIDSAPPISIDTISHLIIDEVHERDTNTDFALTLLKGMLMSKSAQTNMPRLVLMSATASSELFLNYFTIPGCASPAAIDVPGKTYPVDIKWLSDCEKFAGKSMFTRQPATNKNISGENFNFEIINSIALSPYVKDRIDNEFICTLIAKIVEQEQQQSEGSLQGNVRTTGAILVFLPGLSEINTLARCLSAPKKALTSDINICTILKLHSSTPKADQGRVFQQSSKFKIVLSTNLAETSLTIPDVSHVIDSCFVKESRYNSQSRINELVTVWTSHASMKQRAGRAGRTSQGVCWRLCHESFSNEYLLASTPPEMVRTPLDELLLQVCLLYEQRRGTQEVAFAQGIRPHKFLSLTPTPPPETNIIQACRHLLEVEALNIVEFGENCEDSSQCLYRLTSLGYHLSRLPMDVKVGKILIIGAMLGCLDNALTIAASLSCTKSCFLRSSRDRPLDAACIDAQNSLIENGFGGRDWPGGTAKGDLIAVIAVHRAWMVQKKDKTVNIWTFCRSHGLDANILLEIDLLRDQFSDLVFDAGLASGADDSDMNNDDALLTSCCLTAGLYPNICILIRPSKGKGGPRFGKLLTKENDACRPSSDSFQGNRVKNASESGKDAYAVYHCKHKTIGASSYQDQRSAETFLSNVNFISKFSLLLFGGHIHLTKNALIVDGWLKFKVSDDGGKSKGGDVNNAVLILSLRNLVDRVILEHVKETCCSHEQKLTMIDRHKRIIGVLRKLLAEEG